ncbi:MAG: DUF6328 family protein [Gemmatimonadaceae bacterium]
MDTANARREQDDAMSLDSAASRLLDECRMVLPGIQALFGFQLIAVFSDRFASALVRSEQWMHLVAIASIVIAIALVMAPAALHRQTQREGITEGFIELSSHLLRSSMPLLAFAICLDLYLVARIVLASRAGASIVAIGLLGVFTLFWFALPRSGLLQRLVGRGTDVHARRPLGRSG